MSRLFDQLTQSMGDLVQAPGIQLGLQVVGAYLVIVWLAAAFWAYRDMGQRTGGLVLPVVDAALVILATPLLFPAMLLVHWVVRPGDTVAERQERLLRSAALAEELPGACAVCGSPVQQDWLACPACGTTQRHRCVACDRLVELDWSVCAWCGAALADVSSTIPSPVEVSSGASAGGPTDVPAEPAPAFSLADLRRMVLDR